MPSSLETLYSVISPSELAVALGYKLTQFDETTFYYTDPLQGVVWVTPKGFLIDNPQSAVKTWTIVDFIARELVTVRQQVSKEDCYRVGMQELFRMFEDKLPQEADKESMIIHLAAEANIRRQIFLEFFYPEPNPAPTIREANLLSFLDTKRRSISHHPTAVMVFGEAKFKALKELLRKLDSTREFNFPTEPRFVLPYLSDFGTVTGFETCKDLRGDPSYQRFVIDGEMFGYNGLLSWRPGNKVFLSTDPFHGLAINAQFTDHQIKGVALTPTADRMSSVFSWLPKEAIFIARPTHTATHFLQTPALLCKAGVGVSVTDDADPLAMYGKPTVSWTDFVLSRIVSQIEKDGDQILPMTRLFITSCPARPEFKQRLARMLRTQRMHRACLELETILHDGLFEETPRAFIFLTSKGYVLEEKSRRGIKVPLTNFILELKSRVIFPNVSQSSYEVDVIMGGRRTSRLLSDDDLNDIGKLDRTLRSRPEAVGDLGGDTTPTVYDRQQARILVRGWKMIMAKLPVVTGISYLGWNMDRSVFYGPSFTVSSSGFESDVKVLQEGILALQHYTNDTWDIGAVSTDIPEPVANIISQAVAMVARHHMGFPIQPVKIRNGPMASSMLERLFAGIGQTSAVFFNGNVRPHTELNGNTGFPGWALGYTASQTTRSKLPFFMLMDCGLNIQERFSDEVMDNAVATFRTVFISVILKLIRTRGAIFERSNSILYDNSLVREGRRLICESLDLDSWPAAPAPYETIEKMLRGIPLSDTARYFTQSLRQQLIWINLDVLPEKVSKTDLFMELTPLVKHIRDLGSAIEIDAMSGTEMLNTFYNERAFTTPVDTDELLAQVPGNTAR